MQKFKDVLGFLAVLLFWSFVGIVVGHLFVIAVATIFQFTGENIVSQHAEIGPHKGLFDYFDSKYDTDSPIFRIVGWVAFLGNIACIVIGIISGLYKGRLFYSSS
ncbi:MAG: hypothetical protein OXD54_08395 [Candidatus Poribacteria bacterium]|nr:hypothetical protein [Candidatus Poribacteria bacterium]